MEPHIFGNKIRLLQGLFPWAHKATTNLQRYTAPGFICRGHDQIGLPNKQKRKLPDLFLLNKGIMG
jgi:hypothetical protein